MDEKHLCDGQVVCPWHGLRFEAVVLGNGGLLALSAGDGPT